MQIYSGNANNNLSLDIGRTTYELQACVAYTGGQYCSDANGGDAVIRVYDSTKTLRLLAGAGLSRIGYGVGTSTDVTSYIACDIPYQIGCHGDKGRRSCGSKILV